MPNMTFEGRYLKVDPKYWTYLVSCYGEQGLLDQLKSADCWLDANPRRRPRNQKRFLTNWLNRAAREWAEKCAKDKQVERELRVGTGPRPFECRVCHRRLIAAFFPATCPKCGALRSFLEGV